jgi:hypothetical protein
LTRSALWAFATSDLIFALAEGGLIAGAAIWLGPDALAAAREFLREQRESERPPPAS